MSLADANRKYFDTIGDSYDSKPWFAKVNQEVADALRSRLDWIGIPFSKTGPSDDVNEARLLDYACGPGTMSRIFGPYVTVTTGIDVSPNMIAAYNARAATSEPPLAAKGYVADLFSNPPPSTLSSQEFFNYDLATVGFGFHHFSDVIHAASVLKTRLRPGGTLLITEFLEGGDLSADENGNPIEDSIGDHTGSIDPSKHNDHNHHHHHHDHGHGHHHHHHHTPAQSEGPHTPTVRRDAHHVVTPHFTIAGVHEFFDKAGFVDVDVQVLEKKVYMEFAGRKMWRTVLFARGKRPVGDIEKSEL